MANVINQGLLSASAKKEPAGNFVHIGNNDYPYVQIGTRLWLSVNLKEDLTDSVWYNNDRITYEPLNYGKLYRLNSIMDSSGNPNSEFAAIIPSGWRFPNVNDRYSIQSYSAKQLKSATNWNGVDELGFNALPSGYYDGAFRQAGSMFLTALEKISGYNKYNGLNFRTETDYSWAWDIDASTYKVSIRLVKDA